MGIVALFALPLLLAACGGSTKATDTPAPTKAATSVAAGMTAPAPTRQRQVHRAGRARR